MKKLYFLILFLLTTTITYSNGIIIVDAGEGTTLKMTNSAVNVDVNNQVALIVTSQLFFNDTGNSFPISYGFPMPDSASGTQLRWRINGGDWIYAVFEAGQQDPPVGGGSSMDPNMEQYLGATPLFFNFDNPIQNEDLIEVELTYVQLLEYKFGIVTFNYPSDYSLIQTGIIEQNQSIDFQLFSDRTIDFLAIDDYPATITNDGNIASLYYIETGTTSLNNIVITYQLASDELGIIDFSTLLEEQTCDEFGNGFLGLIIEPESNPNTEVIEKVFTLIIDKSGSMSGLKMEQAKEAATFIVNNLNANDYFNLISFETTVNSFKPDHVIFNSTNQTDALNYISNLNAGGGTNISDALTDAIYQFGATDPNKANMIIFFTDGQATAGPTTSTQGILDNVEAAINANETSIFLHTFGIGNSVNTQLLTLLALENQGLSIFLADDEIESVITDFYLTIRNPVLLNTEIQFTPNIVSEIYPNPIPNLYKGQQLILTGRYDTPQLVNIELTGNAFNNTVEYTYDVDLADTAIQNLSFLPKIWAKAKIEFLQFLFYSLPTGSQEAMDTQALIEEISICYQVLSDFTIFTGGGASDIEDLLSEYDEFKVKFYPNPFSNETYASVDLLYEQSIIITIYDINGKLIKFISLDGETGRNLITWNGTDMNGNTVEPGIYFYKIETRSNKHFGKLIKK